MMTKLTPSVAQELLQHHACRHDDVTHPTSSLGFLGSLRPYSGLNVANFHEVMACIALLASELANANCCERNLVAAIWGICHLGRAWGANPDSLLRINNLITPEDAARLEGWIDQISYTTFCLLDGCGEEVAFEFYDPEST